MPLGSAPGQADTPDGIAVDLQGHVYLTDRGHSRLQKFSATGRLLAVLGTGTAGTAPGQFDTPFGVTVDGWGNVYVGDTKNNRIVKLAPDGRFLAAWGSAGTGRGQFNLPRAVAVDHAGDIYVADKHNNRIQELSPAGAFIRRWGAAGGDGSQGAGNGEFFDPYGVALDEAGHVYVADEGNNRVQEFSATGTFLRLVGGPGSAPGQFDEPYAIAVDCRSSVWVNDEGNSRVQRLGDTAAPAPRCPPVLTVGLAAHHRAITATLTCDLPCTATVRATAAGRRGRAVKRTLLARHPVAVRLTVPRAARRAQVTATADGFGGRAKAVRRRVAVRG